MRHIGSLPDENHAQRFGDYLLSAGMKNQVEAASSGWAVWVEDDDKLDQAKSELEAFLVNPTDAKYSGVSRQAERIRVTEEKKQQRLAKRFHDVRTSWGQPNQIGQPVTILLIAACCVVAFLTRAGEQMRPVGTALQIASLTAEQEQREEAEEIYIDPGLGQVRRGQVWRLITPMFLHFGILHLVFNLLWLRDLGSQIELNRGTWFFLAFVLASAVLSNLAQYIWGGYTFGGMSGVVYALFGYVWIKGRYEPHLGLNVSQQTVIIMLGWLVLCMIQVFLPIANAAHLVGLVAGVVAAYAPIEFRKLRRRLRS